MKAMLRSKRKERRHKINLQKLITIVHRAEKVTANPSLMTTTTTTMMMNKKIKKIIRKIPCRLSRMGEDKEGRSLARRRSTLHHSTTICTRGSARGIRSTSKTSLITSSSSTKTPAQLTTRPQPPQTVRATKPISRQETATITR